MEEPKILILDEPFDALDKKSNETLKVYLDDFIKKTGKIETSFEKKENIKKTTKLVKIDEDLHKELKIYSALNGTNIKDNTEQAIREFLEKYKGHL